MPENKVAPMDTADPARGSPSPAVLVVAMQQSLYDNEASASIWTPDDEYDLSLGNFTAVFGSQELMVEKTDDDPLAIPPVDHPTAPPADPATALLAAPSAAPPTWSQDKDYDVSADGAGDTFNKPRALSAAAMLAPTPTIAAVDPSPLRDNDRLDTDEERNLSQSIQSVSTPSIAGAVELSATSSLIRHESHHCSAEELPRNCTPSFRLGKYAQSLLGGGPDVSMDTLRLKAAVVDPEDEEAIYEVPVTVNPNVPEAPVLTDVYFWARGWDMNTAHGSRQPAWLHGSVLTRKATEEALHSFGLLDGSFLIRERELKSPEMTAKYALSVVVNRHIEHLLIECSASKKRYSMKSSKHFPAVRGLVTLQQLVDALAVTTTPGRLKAAVEIPYRSTLEENVLPDWYHPDASREYVVRVLEGARGGCFLVRPTSPALLAYFLSIKAQGIVYHHVLAPKGAVWTLNSELVLGCTLRDVVQNLMARPPAFFKHQLCSFIRRRPPLLLIPILPAVGEEAPQPPPRPSQQKQATVPLSHLFDPPLVPMPPPRNAKAFFGDNTPTPMLPANSPRMNTLPLTAQAQSSPPPLPRSRPPPLVISPESTSAAWTQQPPALRQGVSGAGNNSPLNIHRSAGPPASGSPQTPRSAVDARLLVAATLADPRSGGPSSAHRFPASASDYEDANKIFNIPAKSLLTPGTRLVQQHDGVPPLFTSIQDCPIIDLEQPVSVAATHLVVGQLLRFQRTASGGGELVQVPTRPDPSTQSTTP